MTMPWWTSVRGKQLAQGDLLPDCLLPVFTGDSSVGAELQAIEEELERARLIIVTQSCDLENNKVNHAAMCPIFSLEEFEQVNIKFRKKEAWENVRKGRIEGLHLLASPDAPTDNRRALVVDFGHIVSLPIQYLEAHAAFIGNRWRLCSPFLEHFSQTFARFFMRVGLPTAITPYK